MKRIARQSSATQTQTQATHAFNWLHASAMALIVLAAAGCAHTGQDDHKTKPDKLVETASFYWEYAALATDVYKRGSHVDTQLSMVLMSSWLRDEVAATKDLGVRSDYARLIEPNARSEQPGSRSHPCKDDFPLLVYNSNTSLDAIASVDCQRDAAVTSDGEKEPPPVENKFSDRDPETEKDCYYDGKNDPFVPLHLAIQEFKWSPVPELQRQLHPRGWSIFVPDLVIDVWRRPIVVVGASAPTVEYALVFRGTEGTGGWMSNFRVLTAFTPFVWDQYWQAGAATKDLVHQIQNLHGLSDKLFQRKFATQVRITSVGHSLGGGLAKYVFMRVPDLTRVVAFDPSPVDGSSSFSSVPVSAENKKRGKRDRDSVMTGRKQPVDHHFRAPEAAIFTLYEEGEAMTRIAGCYNGPIWGAEGGPKVHCDSVNLSGGSVLRQHNMPQLACKLFLAKNGKPTR